MPGLVLDLGSSFLAGAAEHVYQAEAHLAAGWGELRDHRDRVPPDTLRQVEAACEVARALATALATLTRRGPLATSLDRVSEPCAEQVPGTPEQR